MANAIQLTAHMLDVRDTMRRFWRDRYTEKVEPYREAIRNNSVAHPDRQKLTCALDVCARMAQEFPWDGMVLGLAIAATVEECDQP